MKLLSLCSTIIFGLIILSANICSAITIHVPNDQPTIQLALDSASVGDVIQVACGTYFEHDITMKSGVYLTSESGEANCVTIDARQMGRVFYCNGVDATASIVGLSLTGGLASYGGGMYLAGSTLTIESCVFIDNHASIHGGGVYHVSETIAPEIIDCVFVGNQAGNNGGGMYCGPYSGTILTSCTFEENLASNAGGAICCFRSGLTCTDCMFMNNMANYGGGIFTSEGSATLSSCTISGNQAGNGGGIDYDWESSGILTNCTFSGNNASGDGGGVYFGRLSGGTLTGCLFSGNQASNKGGGIYHNGGLWAPPRVMSCTFSDNQAEYGGGLCISAESRINIENSIIAFSVSGEAVFVDNYDARASLTCCDVYGNANGDWINYIENQYGSNGNISEDPLFCSPHTGQYSLQIGSPCAPPGNTDCGLIGAMQVECDAFAPVITDVPDDQGGILSISWVAFDHDMPDIPDPLYKYVVQRLGDNTWVSICELPAEQHQSYSIDIETDDIYIIGEPAPISYYRVLGYTADQRVTFISQVVGGYSIDNLPPDAIQLNVYDNITYRFISWHNQIVSDFLKTCLYRGDSPDFVPGEPIQCGAEEAYQETHLNWYAYKARSFDIHGNASEWSNEVVGQYPTGVPGEMPTVLRLYPNQPNPFNPQTTIKYDVPVDGRTTLRIYDVRGALVRTLVDADLPRGSHQATWDGRDASGRGMASGSYFARLEAGGRGETVRMSLVR